MWQDRNIPAVDLSADADRPLTARSVVASVLLGTTPPRLPVGLLVRTGELFGISEGAVRVALSRMAAAGEVRATDRGYELAGGLLERQARQTQSRAAATRTWTGGWELWVVRTGARHAATRAELRAAAAAVRLAELREGVWARPDNLLPDRSRDARGTLRRQCDGFVATLATGLGEDSEDEPLAHRLWDLDGWSHRASRLTDRLAASIGPLAAGDTNALAPGFVLSASVLRHLQADPLLPAVLLPPDWPGPVLRRTYDEFDDTYRALLAAWFGSSVAARSDRLMR